MNLSDQMAFNNPRVSAVTQFLFRDVGPRNRYGNDLKNKWFTWQSGITYGNGKPKPSLAAYALQLNVTYGGQNPDGTLKVNIWGQVRGAEKGKPQMVYLQYRPQGTTAGVTWTS